MKCKDFQKRYLYNNTCLGTLSIRTDGRYLEASLQNNFLWNLASSLYIKHWLGFFTFKKFVFCSASIINYFSIS